MTADALLSLSAIETAVYDPPRLGHEFELGPEHGLLAFPDSPFLAAVCTHCNIIRGVEQWPSDKQPCPSRPVPDPDWQACLIAADICEDMQDDALGAWWRWLERERKVPTHNQLSGYWDWWRKPMASSPAAHIHLEASVCDVTYFKLTCHQVSMNRAQYPTRRAAYLDLARVYCDQWRQEHEMRKELTV